MIGDFDSWCVSIRLAMSDRKVLVGFTDGTVDVWDVKGILSGTVSFLLCVRHSLFLTGNAYPDYAGSHIYRSRCAATEPSAEPIARRRPPAAGLGTQRFFAGRSRNWTRVQDPTQT